MAKPVPYYQEGTTGADTLFGDDRRNEIWGLAGDDVISLGAGDDRGVGNDGNDTIYGGLGNDWLQGGDGNDALHGDAGNDEIWGQKGEDAISGGDGADWIWGGADSDRLAGGLGADTFVYKTIWESSTRAYSGPDPEFANMRGDDLSTAELEGVDIIEDFRTGTDKIDLSVIDANENTVVVSTRRGITGNEGFNIVDVASGRAGELTLQYDAASGLTTISGYVNDDFVPDIVIQVAGPVNPYIDLTL